MVCLGNICRSPLAEGILQTKVGTHVLVDSAGTAGHHVGELPDERSIRIAEKYNIDITHQRSRKFIVEDFDRFDLIYAMDHSNYNTILTLSRNEADRLKVRMILNEVTPNSNKNVPDPYYGGTQGFENVYKMLEEACTIIATKHTV